MINIGDKIPAFTLQNQDGTPVDIMEFIGQKTVVLYFYPKDDTPGCTKEACSFRDQYTVFQDLGCEVIGISSDTPKAHKEFAIKYKLPFPLLADEKKEVRTLFGVPKSLFGLLPGRVTYIIDKTGIVRGIFNSQLNATQHIDEALKVVRGM
ncbi:MAG: peroxiredoxin [Cryomorphaceae bacterium]|nr:peroxiredoxin [Cryomorphaceae bacterium]